MSKIKAFLHNVCTHTGLDWNKPTEGEIVDTRSAWAKPVSELSKYVHVTPGVIACYVAA